MQRETYDRPNCPYFFKLISMLADLLAVGDVKRRYGLLNLPNSFVKTGDMNSAILYLI